MLRRCLRVHGMGQGYLRHMFFSLKRWLRLSRLMRHLREATVRKGDTSDLLARNLQ